MFEYQPSQALLANKIILITGAGDGIGKQAALSYAAHGATVVLLGRTEQKLIQVYDEIVANGGATPAIITLDLQTATTAQYAELAQLVTHEFGRLDGLLHNASLLGSLGLIEQMDIDSLETVLKVNVTAQAALTQAVMPLLRAAPSASIIFTSSSVGRKGRAFWGAYAISKFATEGMMQTLADELEDSNIRTNSINPGGTRTSMRASAYPAEDPMTLKTPADIMPVYLYLMGDDSLNDNGKAFNAQ
ncbi:YciK family oxidoreductase [Shewanella sp. C32]|uniref:YciK family oxidoreductase n=1 Tax=Shewanella electrica TaxID=515560 RepID=A0ABT2FHE2_9GAMM|nr:YciK family oxidoreductase [Shewanella electrica]MCH1923652.1 YciK family oxidoreductase [Shewanella electrica]MCS4555747.1 YciK family oxidoreductase [Shewanella electrica]